MLEILSWRYYGLIKNWLSQQLVRQREAIATKVLSDSHSWLHRIKCILHFNVVHLEATLMQNVAIATPMRLLEVFTSAQTYQSTGDSQKVDSILSSIWSYLINRHFFKQMRHIIETKTPEPFESTARAPTPLSETLLDLVLRPVRTVKASNNNANNIFKSLFDQLFRGPLSPHIKNFVLIHLTTEPKNFIRAEHLIDSLLPEYSNSCDSITISLSPNIWLFYSFLKLVSVQTANIEANYAVKYLHILRSLSTSLSEIVVSSFNSEPDSDDGEPMEIAEENANCVSGIDDKTLIEQLIALLNESSNVSLIIKVIDNQEAMNGSQTLISLSCLCHSLLSFHTLAVNQYR